MLPIHPRLVHFAVALLITTAIFGLLALIFKNKRSTFIDMTFWSLFFGVIWAIVAIITGLLEEETLAHNEAIHEIMKTHKTLGIIFTSIFFVLFIWFLIRKSKLKIGEFRVMVIVMVLTAVVVGYSAHLGGKMVYKEGAGVIPMEPIIQEESHHHHEGESEEHHNEP